MLKVDLQVRRLAGVVALLFLAVTIASAQQPTAALRGQVLDQLGGAMVGANVSVVSSTGVVKTVRTNADGAYVVTALAPGKYTVRVTAKGFAPYEAPDVEVATSIKDPFVVTMTVATTEAEVVVTEDTTTVNTEPENNASALVLKGSDIDSLPEDPDELLAALQALAGPSAGPNGGQMFIDGFANGRIPPRDSIREIRINSNPFSSEYDRLGFGRFEILTRPGSDRYRGNTNFNFNDESLNARNPYATTRAPHQVRSFGANFGGPIIKKKSSFFFDIDRNVTEDNAVINAAVLDSSFNVVPFRETVITPRHRFSFSPRVDYQINTSNTLIARYSYSRSSTENSGIGTFDLPTRAYSSKTSENNFQLTETSVINQKIVNETRFSFSRSQRRQVGDNSIPTVRVQDSFTGGGPQVGNSGSKDTRIELSNFTSWVQGNHALKVGGRLRRVSNQDVSRNNFGGSFTFTTMAQYRNTIQGVAGARPTEFSISGGEPLAEVSQSEVGFFVQDDWRVRPNLTLSLGLRYENQSNINSNMNFAPRLAFAWSPGKLGAGGRGASTVIRGGFGVFYDRFGENYTLQTIRNDGAHQLQFLVTDPVLLGLPVFTLNGVTNVPSAQALSAFQLPQTIRTIDPNLQVPYTLQSSISFERQLPRNTNLTVTYINTRNLHMLRTRNLGAPVVTSLPYIPVQGQLLQSRYQYEASGVLNQSQLVVGLNTRFTQRVSLFARYTLGKVSSDTDGAGSFPAYTYDLSDEYGRSGNDVRHRFSLGGQLTLPWNIRLNPMIIASSSSPFNITIGRDLNGDGMFTERPAFATDLTRPSVRVTPFGAFDSLPLPDQIIIPRNYGVGPSSYNVNLRVSRSFSFGPSRNANNNQRAAGAASGQQPAGGGGGGGARGGGGPGGGPGGGGMMGMGGFGGEGDKRFNLTLSVNFSNLLNHVNAGRPIGNLSSPLFGLSNSSGGFFGGFGGGGGSSAGNRRVDLSVRLSF